MSETNLCRLKYQPVVADCMRLALSKMPFTQIYKTRRIRNKLPNSCSLSIIKKKKLYRITSQPSIRKDFYVKRGQNLKKTKIRKLLKCFPQFKNRLNYSSSMKIQYDVQFFFTLHSQVDVSVLDPVPVMGNFGLKIQYKPSIKFRFQRN